MNSQPLRFLIVDDDDVDREKTDRYLKSISPHFLITEASSGKEVINLIQQKKFDCVILDYRLSDLEGSELLKPLKEHKAFPTPILMLSGLGDETLAAEAIKKGAFAYIPKRALTQERLQGYIEKGLSWAETEHENQEIERRFTELANGLPQLIWTCKTTGECDFLNKQWENFTGIPAEEQLGFKWLEQLHPNDREIVINAWNQSVENSEPLNCQYRLRRHDGCYRLFDTRALPVHNLEGQIVRWTGSCTDVTEAEEARLNSAYLAAIVSSSIDAIISKDLNGYVTSWNRSAERLFGYSPDEAIGKHIRELIIPPELHEEEEKLITRLKAGENIRAFETIRRGKDGRKFPVSLTFSPIKDSKGKTLGFAKIARNISERLAVESALLSSEERFRTSFDSAPVGMALVALNGKFIEVNKALLDLLHIDFNNLVQLKQLEITHPEDHTKEQYEISRLIESQSTVRFEKRLLHNNHEITVLVSIALLYKNERPDALLYQYVDLTERKIYEDRLINLAHFDSLTGLANRSKLVQELEKLLYESERHQHSFAVLFCDLDHFKRVNDSLGHEIGDELLKSVASRLQRGLRKEDTIARIGGDEFVILLPTVRNFEQIVGIAKKIITKLQAPIQIGEHRLHVGVSIGIALYPADGNDTSTLLRNADSALYDAKNKGRNCFSLYRKELTEFVESRLKLDADLRLAIEEEQFFLHFQPVINLQTSEVISAEALIRWKHPERGLIPPLDFIPYAQETGLINTIGEWVINRACKTIKAWALAGITIPIAINISARQFKEKDLAYRIEKAIRAYSINPSFLHLEITEELLMEDTEHNLSQLDQLKNIGLKIYMDDFGIGYSSLSYIIRFAPDYLKIDKSFVNKIGSAAHHNAMIETIIGLQQVLPMKIIAEGIETDCQRIFLRDKGCGYGQGFLFSKPLPEKEFLQFLKKPLIADEKNHSKLLKRRPNSA